MNARYEVEDVIGRGAMGVVYRARQTGTGHRVVAYKRVAIDDPELRARLHDEAQVLALLDHPNIIRIFEVVDDNGGVAIVMQFAAGGSLADHLSIHGSVPPGFAVETLTAMADALASAHRRGVVHGDVKPSNILFTADRHPLLADFGVAQPAGSPGRAGGTAGYLDPVLGDRPCDPAADVYAFGVVAFEMLTGRRPQTAGAAQALPSAIPAAVADAVVAALDPDRDQRPTAAALAAMFRNAVAALPAQMRTATSGTDASAATRGENPWGSRGQAPPTTPRAEPPTQRVGPSPPPTPVPPAEERVVPWRRLIAIAVTLLLVPPAVVHAVHASSQRAAAPAALPLCSGVSVPSARRGHDVLTVDAHGRGCRVWVRVGEGVVELGGRGEAVRWRLGSRDDQLLVGDWDCDGIATPALYQPASGRVFLFDAWPTRSRRLRSASAYDTGVRGGLARSPLDGCGTPRVAEREPAIAVSTVD